MIQSELFCWRSAITDLHSSRRWDPPKEEYAMILTLSSFAVFMSLRACSRCPRCMASARRCNLGGHDGVDGMCHTKGRSRDLKESEVFGSREDNHPDSIKQQLLT